MKRLESGSVFTGEEVLSIDRKQKRVKTNLRELKYEHLISTMPFPRLLELCEMEYESAVYSCNKVLVFNLGFVKEETSATIGYTSLKINTCFIE